MKLKMLLKKFENPENESNCEITYNEIENALKKI